MADSKEDIATQALAKLGEPSISSFEEDSDAAEAVSKLYEPTIQMLLGAYQWRWCDTRKQLAKDGAAVPVNEWSYGYLLPDLKTDRVGPPLEVFNSTALRARAVFDFEVEQRWLWTNYETIVIRYTKRLNEIYWPAFFEVLAVEALAAALAMPITENASKAEYHQVLAYGTPAEGMRGGLFRMATTSDVKGTATKGLLDDHDIMTGARFGGASRGYY